ncbi:MAG: hypothetical protein RLW62_02355 [Gammaproteobacteria bacterium]
MARTAARGPRRRTVLALLALLAAAPGSGLAYSSYGLGTLSCATYLERRGEDRAAGSMDRTVFIHAWLNGYLTAGNMMRGLVGDHVNDIRVNIHAVVDWLDAHCAGRREALVAEALETFWVEATAAKETLRRHGARQVLEAHESAPP